MKMMCKLNFLYAVLILIVVQSKYTILAEQVDLNHQEAKQANVESNTNVGLSDLERAKRSLTTICVEIKPHTPSDEPYFMCKGTDLPMLHRSGNIAIYGGKSSGNNSGGNQQKHQQQTLQDTSFPKNNQLYQQQHSKSSESLSHRPSTKHDEPYGGTFSKTDTNRGQYFHPKTTTFSESKYKNPNAGIESIKDSENNDGSANSYETHREYYEAPIIDTFNSDSYSSANARLHQGPFIDYRRPFTSDGIGSQNNRGNYEKPYFGIRSSFDPGYKHTNDATTYEKRTGSDEKDTTIYEHIPTNARTFAPQSFNYPNDELVSSNAFPYSENLSKEYAPNTYAIPSAIASDISKATDSFAQMQFPINPVQGGARFTELEDDVVGVPNWGFSPEEFNIVSSTPELSKSLLPFDGRNYKSNQPVIPKDYFEDPVLRTFYESLVDLPTLRLQETLPSQSCPPNDKSREPYNLGAKFNPTPAGYPQSFYPPVLISLPCCGGQPTQPYGNAGSVYNMGMSNPFQEPLVGLNNPFANLFGLNRSFQWSHLWNLINPFNNLLGEPNPMMVPHNGLVGMPHYYMGPGQAMMPSANRYISQENQMLGSSASNNGKSSGIVGAQNPFSVLASLSSSSSGATEATTPTDFDYKNADSTTAATSATSADANTSEDSEEDGLYENVGKKSEQLASSTQNPNNRETNAPQVGATINSSSEESTNTFNESTSPPKLTTEIKESREAIQDRYQEFAGKAKALVIKAKQQSSEVDSELPSSPLSFSSSYNVKRHNPKIVGYTQRKYVQQLQ